MNNITLTLGDIAFEDTEIPEKIAVGGKQALAVHDLVGGVRVVDAMGREDGPLEWSGLLRGSKALARARALDALRIAGKPLMLTWSEYRYWVVVGEFRADFERFYQIPYHISCVVVVDYAGADAARKTNSVDSLIKGDMAVANKLAGQVGDAKLSGLMGTLNGAISGVSSFAAAAQSTINGVLAPLVAVQAQVSTLIASTTNTIQSVTTLGGILPNNPIAQQAARLTGQVNAMVQAPALVNLKSVLGRVQTNLGSINSGAQSLTTAGGSLFNIAAKVYGSATAWTGIARANGVTDPQIAGVQTLQVPATADTTDGVLNA